MLNLFLTGDCNLKCSYCFASDFVNKGMKEFSIENIVKILDFIKINGTNQIGILGGEPFLHSKITDILKILRDNNDIKDIFIYTNGLLLEKYIDNLYDKKFKLLINCNSPESLGKSYIKLVNNIEMLNKLNSDRISIGINLPFVDFEYNYIFDLLHKFNKKILRFSFATSNEEKKTIKNPIEYFEIIKPYIMAFYNDCFKNDIIPFPSCNTMPPCILQKDDKKILVKLFLKSMYWGYNSVPLLFFYKCNPVIDVFPNLNASRCFGFSESCMVPLFKFKSLNEIYNYFVENIDENKNTFKNTNKKCINCEYKKMKLCRLCSSYS